MRNAHYILCLRLFVLWVPSHDEREHNVMVQIKMEFCRPIDRGHANLYCTFEMFIFKRARSYKSLCMFCVSFCTAVQVVKEGHVEDFQCLNV